MAQAAVSTHKPPTLTDTLRASSRDSRSRRRQCPSGEIHAVNRDSNATFSDEGDTESDLDTDSDVDTSVDSDRQSEKTKNLKSGGWGGALGNENGDMSPKLAILAATAIGATVFGWVTLKLQTRMARHPMRPLEGELAHVLKHPKLEHKLSTFTPTDWEEYAATLESLKQMELATSRGKGDGSSGSAAAMSALKLDPVGSAVISRLDEYQDALNATPDPAFIASAIQSLGKREEAVTEPVVLHHALKYGMPSSSQDLRFLRNFVLDFDTRTRNPRWVLEHITRDQTQGTANRKNLKCYEDEELHPRFRSLLSAFKDSGFDKGHMAPAANHKETRDAMRDTFVLSNICPQVGDGFNRDYWARFEQFVRVLAHTCDDVYVVTGPLFLPVKNSDGYRMQHLMIGQPPNMMAVPTHFFKVVLAETAGKRADGGASREVVIGAFVMPNAPLQPHLPLTAFLVPLEALEEAAGLQFFPGFLNAERRAAVDAAALAYRKWVPGASLDFFQPPKALLALTEPVRVANSAVVERNVAAFSAPSDASSSVKVAHLCGVVECELPEEGWWMTSKNRRT